MKKVEHIVELRGEASFKDGIRPEAAGAVLTCIPDLIRDSIRMGILRSSRRPGKPPAGLSMAWTGIVFQGQSSESDGSTQLRFTAPRLEDVAPRLFAQSKLFEDVVSPDDTGFDLAGRMVADIAMRREESERFDPPLLARIVKFEKVLRTGIDTLHLAGNKLDELQRTDINGDVIDSARKLFQETPAPHRVRVSGVLDMIRVSNRLFELLLPGDQCVRAVWTASSVVHLRDYLSKEVVIEGTAVYRPSGTLLRIDAEAIDLATSRDSFFSTLPTPPSRTLSLKSLHRPQHERTGINALWGSWEGDETDAELLAALMEIR